MLFHYQDLDHSIRSLMLLEAEVDKLAVSEYYGRRLTPKGRSDWPGLLRDAIEKGNSETLAAALRETGRLKTHEDRNGKPVRVPVNAADVLAQGEFNRYYIRAVCLLAIERGIKEVIVYRGRYSENPRPESEAMIGRAIDAKQLMDDIREHPGVETLLGVPLVNSGLSVRLP